MHPPFEELQEFYGRTFFHILEQSTHFWHNASKEPPSPLYEMPALITWEAFSEWQNKLAQNPEFFFKTLQNFSQELYKIWKASLCKNAIGTTCDIYPEQEEKQDRRFQHIGWETSPHFWFLKQSYLATSNFLLSLIDDLPDLDDQEKKKARFYLKQFLNAFSPSNFPTTNPRVLERIFETGGENIFHGWERFLKDYKQGGKSFLSFMSQPRTFRVGSNLAITPGEVIFQNDLFQLIQYHPTTEKVYAKPLLIIPPWINKFYIFDLRSTNSFVKWALDQGHTVFIMSWANPGEQHAQKTMTDYMNEGLLTAVDIVKKITQSKDVNAIGYCISGNLLACTLSYLEAKGDQSIASATFLATMIDFSLLDELSLFIEEDYIKTIELMMDQQGYLDEYVMAMTFSLLRSNDMIWNFFVSKYLLSDEPFPIDFLYWNADSTRLPAQVHRYFLREICQKNGLMSAGKITLNQHPVDLTTITTPSFVVAARDDHIAPWRGCYHITQLLKGPTEFVLTSSGHVAGIINPPTAMKYDYLMGEGSYPSKPDTWIKKAKRTPGSWWPQWQNWITPHAGPSIPGRKVGTHPHFPILEHAPGSFVKRSTT